MDGMGQRMVEIRKARGKTCAEMANMLGMTLQGYYKLENGDNGKTFAKLPVIAKLLGCRIDDLFPEMDEVKTDSAVGFEDSLDDLEL